MPQTRDNIDAGSIEFVIDSACTSLAGRIILGPKADFLARAGLYTDYKLHIGADAIFYIPSACIIDASHVHECFNIYLYGPHRYIVATNKECRTLEC